MDNNRDLHRENWREMFLKANSKSDNEILIPDFLEDETVKYWEW